MIEYIGALIIGTILGYVIRGEQKPNEEPNYKIDKLNEDVLYYKKLTKTLVEENTQLRAELRNKK